MTAPHIGNTGINTEDPESVDGSPHVAGFVMRDPSPISSNWRSEETLDDHLRRHGVVAIGGVDTRALTRKIRDDGAQNGCIGTEAPDVLGGARRARPPRWKGSTWSPGSRPRRAYEFTERPRCVEHAAVGRAPVATRSRHAPRGRLGLRRQEEHPALPGGFWLSGHRGTGAHARRGDSWRSRRTASSCPTAPGIPPPSTTPSPPSRICSASGPSSASASATSCSPARWARAPTSSSSATAA